jgi:hypothetical protein
MCVFRRLLSLTSGDVNVVVIAGGSDVFVWTTLMRDNKPCDSCKVTLYAFPQYAGAAEPSSVEHIGETV